MATWKKILTEADKGISSGNVISVNAAVSDNDFLRIDGNKAEGRSSSEVLSDIGAYASSNPSSYAADQDISGIATNATAIGLRATLASPALSGTPTSTTQAVGNDSTRIATTAFVLANSSTGSGSVTGVTGTAPVSVTSSTTSPTVSMAAATTSVNGYLKATDWTTFNNKGSSSLALGETAATAFEGAKGKAGYDHSLVTGGVHATGTVTGATGTAPVTVSSSATSPVVSMAASTNSVAGYLTSADHTTFASHTTNTGTVTGATGTAPVSVSSSSTSPVVSMAVASGSANGYLSSGNWTTFNNKGSSNLAVGSASTDAHRGDQGATAYTHSQVSGGVHATGTVTSVSAGTGIDISGTATTTPTVNVDLSELVTHTIGTGAGTITISGNLQVTGTTTTIDTETIKLADNIIVLNSNYAGSSPTDGGIEVERGSLTNKQLLWNEAKSNWFADNGTGTGRVMIQKYVNGAPSGSDDGCGNGQFWINTSNWDMYIRTA